MKKTTPTRATGPLHFEDLDPHRFEDLVRRLIYDFRPWRLLEATGRSGTDGERDRLLLLWHNAAAFQVGRVSPGLRLVHEALWCGTVLRARPHVRCRSRSCETR